MASKQNDPLEIFLQNHEHAAPLRPVGEWKKLEAKLVEEIQTQAATAPPALPQWWSPKRWSPTGVGASLCVASFAAVFMWTSTKQTITGTHRHIPAVSRTADSSSVLDSEEVVLDAFFGEDEALEDFEQAYIDVLE